MTVTVRAATMADAGTISALNADVQEIHAKALPRRFKLPSAETFPLSEALKLLADSQNLFFMAHFSAFAAGYVYAEVIRRPETSRTYAHEMIYIHHISVRPHFQGQGVGKALMNAVQSAGRDLGITTLALDVWSFNEAARSFFVRFGLKQYNERLWNL